MRLQATVCRVTVISCLLHMLMILFMALPTSVAQQGDIVVENVDSAFMDARELAFNGDYEAARALANAILDISPGYHDVRILLARTYSWNGEYSQARLELNRVLEADPDYKDALMASLDNELWAENMEQALTLSSDAIRHYPSDEDLLLKRATALSAAEMNREALQVLDRVDQLNPASEASRDLRQSIQESGLNYTMSLAFTHDWFSDIFDPWNKTYLQISRRTGLGSLIVRLNYADRFGYTGFQPEIDFYPSIADGVYGYLNVGYTENSLYPQFRFGGELYVRLGSGFESSGGIRYLDFSSSNVTIFTGSLTKYVGNWYLSGRIYLTPSSVGVSRSLNLTTRHYLNGPENYVGLRGGFGFSPDERRFQDGSGDVFLLQSQYVGIDLFKSISHAFALFGSFDAARQELRFDPGEFIQVFTVNTGVQVRF